MTSARVYVLAAAALGPGGACTSAERRRLDADPRTELRDLAKKVLGQPLRQASHFVELAAIGSRLCLNRLAAAPSPETGVYLGTGLGEVRKTEALFEQVMPPGSGIASPFDFINATANMGAFYVARGAGLLTRNLTVTQGVFSFERALALACDDLRAGTVAQALVGGVDENHFPRTEHLRRLPLRDDQIMGEGSGWLFLSNAPDGARAEIVAVETLPGVSADTGEWAARVASVTDAKPGPAMLLPGHGLSAAQRDALARALGGASCRDYIEECGCYPTAAAYGIGATFDAAPITGLGVHVNLDDRGATAVVVIRFVS
jgi:hypothetical protein